MNKDKKTKFRRKKKARNGGRNRDKPGAQIRNKDGNAKDKSRENAKSNEQATDQAGTQDKNVKEKEKKEEEIVKDDGTTVYDREVRLACMHVSSNHHKY